MTAPTLYPTSFGVNTSIAGGNQTPFLRAPVLRDGGVYAIESQVAVPTSVTGTIIGLVPFQAGARINYSSRIYTGDADTGSTVTYDVGYIYDDSTNNTNNTTAFNTASTVPQAGGFITPANSAGFQYITTGNGWVAITTGGGSTTTAVTISAEINLSYNAAAIYS